MPHYTESPHQDLDLRFLDTIKFVLSLTSIQSIETSLKSLRADIRSRYLVLCGKRSALRKIQLSVMGPHAARGFQNTRSKRQLSEVHAEFHGPRNNTAYLVGAFHPFNRGRMHGHLSGERAERTSNPLAHTFSLFAPSRSDANTARLRRTTGSCTTE